MNTKILKIDKDNVDKELIREAAMLISQGRLVAFPTETVYGLGANGLDEVAVAKIFKAKGRPQDNPLILHISSIEQVNLLVKEIPDIAYECMKRFWPGPLTLLFKKSDLVPNMITAGLDTVAIRMPDHPIALELIQKADVPIAAPSANLSGKPSPTSANHVFQDLNGKIDMIIDGGSTGVGLESTVLDISEDTPMILRPGGITIEVLRQIIPDISQDIGTLKEGDNIIPKSPGQKYRHYAPRADMIVFTGKTNRVVNKIIDEANKLLNNGKRVGIMATKETKDNYTIGKVLVVGSRIDKETIATNLFNTIRLFDECDVDIILAEGIELDNIGMAIMNRMMKASGGKVFIV